MSTLARCGVIGHPIAHSLSPEIHAAFAAQFGRALDYQRIDLAPARLAEGVREFFAAGGTGLNVTLPHKQAAARLADRLGSWAQRLDAVNMLTREADGTLSGENVDGAALVHDLSERYRVDLRGHDVLVLGAGGAGRAAVWALLDAGARQITVANRHPASADALVDAIGMPDRVHSRYWRDLPEIGAFDLILNATSAGVLGEHLQLPFKLVTPRATCYDLSYGRAAADFMGWAHAAGARYAFDGLGMLVEGGAMAYARWFGETPDTEPVFAALRARHPQA